MNSCRRYVLAMEVMKVENRGWGGIGKSKEGAGKSWGWTLGSACAQWAWAGGKGSRK